MRKRALGSVAVCIAIQGGLSAIIERSAKEILIYLQNKMPQLR